MAKKKQNSNGSHAIKNTESPLRLFGEAKESIEEIYLKLENCIKKALQFYSKTRIEQEIITTIDTNRLECLIKSIKIIREILARNQMKVAFFGRTSNGKSTVINAILHDYVLPMGIGHTTGCFLQIQGNPENEAFMQIQRNDGDEERLPIQSVLHIANTLNTNSLECSNLVKIQWPISKCPLLGHQVVLVDSPGVDVEENLDQWIDQHCHDADVFVLVSNAESILNIAEKNFFHKVSEKLSKPNIFILNNRWDFIADYPESEDQVKQQHTERAINFLADELKISTREEAEQRIFFVSARETLQARSPNSNHSYRYREGYENRFEEFKKFERRFEESLSKSAVRTKFKKHSDKGEHTINDLSIIFKQTRNLVTQVSVTKLEELRHNEERHRRIQNLFYVNEKDLKQKILELKKRIQILAETEFDNEVRRLARVVEDFELEFSPSHDKLEYFKDQLYLHVEQSINEDFKSRIKSVISKHVSPLNNAMYNVGSLLSEVRQQKINQIVGSQSYVQDDIFDLGIYKPFYTGFQEDLEFRFSLGLFSIIRKFSFKKTSLDQTQTKIPQTTVSTESDFLTILNGFLMNPPQSPTTVGSLAIGGILVRTVGLRVIVITTVIYGALYAYEYLTWTNTAKEKAFKAQYVRYAKKGLQLCVPSIGQNIAKSIEHKMTSTFSDFKLEVDDESEEIFKKVGLLRSSLENLRKCDEFTRELIGDNDVLLKEFVAFASSFLAA